MMNKKQLEIQKKNKNLFLEYFEKYEDKFSIRKKPIYINKKRIMKKIHKKKLHNRFFLWNELPYSLIIYTINTKIFQHMSNYFYLLKDFIIIKNFRKSYKINILEKKFIGYNCYRVYSENFLTLYENIEAISNYDVNILGIEIQGQLYAIERITKFLQTIKEDLKFFFNFVTTCNADFNKIFNSFGQLDVEFNQNIHKILLICQHIIKSEEVKEE